MKRTSRVVGGTIASVLQILIAIALQIVLMPLILRVAGQETVGVYAILLQIIGYLAVMDLGIGVALNRSLAQAINDEERFHSLLNSGFLFMAVIGIAYASLGALVAWGLPGLFHLSNSIARESQLAMLGLSIWGVLRFPLALYGAALLAIQDLAFPPLAAALSNVARMVIAVIAIQAGQGIIGLSAATIIAEAALSVALMARFSRLRPGFHPQMERRHWDLFKEQLPFGLRAFLGNVQGRVVFSTDNVIVGNLYGAAVTSTYYNTQTPVAVAYNLVFRLADNASPGVNELWVERAWDKLRDIFLRLQRLTLLMVAPIAIGGWFYLRATVGVWVGALQFVGEAMTLWLVLFAVLTTARYVPQVFIYASGDIRRLTHIVTIEAIANIVLSFILGAMLGPHGVALATLISHLPTAAYLQVRAHRDLSIPVSDWLSQTIAPAFLAAIPTTIIAGILSSQFTPNSWGSLSIHIAVIGLVHFASTYKLGLAASDRLAMRYLFDRIVLRRLA